MINVDGHGVPTQAIRYRPEECSVLHERLAALREQFAQFGQPELQQAMEALDCLAVFHEVRCPMLVVAANEPLPGNDLFEAYVRGLRPELDAIAEARDNVHVSWYPSSHAILTEDPCGVARLMERFLARTDLHPEISDGRSGR